jgi:hypothetical protein
VKTSATRPPSSRLMAPPRRCGTAKISNSLLTLRCGSDDFPPGSYAHSTGVARFLFDDAPRQPPFMVECWPYTTQSNSGITHGCRKIRQSGISYMVWMENCLVLSFDSRGYLFSWDYRAGIYRESFEVNTKSMGYQHFGNTVCTGTYLFHVRPCQHCDVLLSG